MLTKEYLRLLEKRKEVQPNLSYSYERVSKARIQRAALMLRETMLDVENGRLK